MKTVKELIRVLERKDASLHDRARACQQLGEFGTGEAVPALAALLADPVLGAYARSGLEGIPDPSASAALRAAVESLQGNARVGVVNSLGVLRDTQSVPALSRLASGPDSDAAKAALRALGRIANQEAIQVLRGALADGPETLRPEAAAGLLLAAELQPGAVALYDAVRSARVPEPYRVAATHGSILARKAQGVDWLVKLLRSEDRETRRIALLTIREISDPRLGAALRGEIGAANPEMKANLILALGDCCRDASSLALIRKETSAGEPVVQEAALRALGKAGEPADAALLLEAVMQGHSAAAPGLARMPGTETDALILKRLASASGTASRVALIELIDARPPSLAAASQLLKLAAGPDAEVSAAALRPLRSLAGPGDVPALIGLLSGPQTAAVESVLYYAGTRTGKPSDAGETLLAALRGAGDDRIKASLMRVLASVGYEKAMPAIAANLRAGNAALSVAALEALGRWPGPAPIGELFGVAEGAADPETRLRALNSALQLAGRAAEQGAAPDAELGKWFGRAARTARSDAERRAVISGLGKWGSAASFGLLTPYLDDAAVKKDAANALIGLAEDLVDGTDPALLLPVVDKIPAANPDLSDRVAALKADLQVRGNPR